MSAFVALRWFVGAAVLTPAVRAAVGAARSRRRVDVGSWRRRVGRVARRRSDRRLDADLPRLAEGVARELSTGAALTAAIAAAAVAVGGPLASDLGDVAAGGVPLATALSDWRSARASKPVDQFVAVALLAADLGGEAGTAFTSVATALRDRADLRDEVRSLTAQSRASAVLLTALPPVAAALLAAIEPATARFLLGSADGLVVVVASTALTAVGWWSMWRLSAVDR